MNHIAGFKDLYAMGSLYLIIGAIIVSGIVVALIYRRIVRTREKIEHKYVHETQQYDAAEEKDASGVVDDTIESKVEMEEKPVVNLEEIDTEIKDLKDEITTKIEKLTSDVEGKKEEVVNKVENIIDTKEEEVIKKVENIIDTKAQDILNKIDDRINKALQTQKNSTASVIEKMVDSLRVEEGVVGISSTEKSEEVVEEKKEFEEPKERDLKVPEEAKTIGESVDFDIQDFLEKNPIGISSSDEFREEAEEKEEIDEKKVGDSI
ncbi:MAG: hypothetical protein SCARUB_00804 [Candidatus Scalindua rubra]|uniref:Uncharacterized protein n=1 Tax=Candidatus Scalindua rubra TaxID=1872076 RepID=A0A1E3XEG4_9BACT|nr:MAG: hypothetical protein SCARUB_00804 [Candidatus Scalindua rubra]